MKMKKIIWVVVLIFILGACSEKEAPSEQEPAEEAVQEEEQDQEAAEEQPAEAVEETEPAETLEEVVDQTSGELSGDAYDKDTLKEQLSDQNFENQSALQIYQTLLSKVNEADQYKEHYEFVQSFTAGIETEVSEAPGDMQLEDGQQVSGSANIAILLDASGSMAQTIGGETKMQLAKKAIDDFVSSMPEGSNVALRVYGHKGSNADADKELSCGSTEVVYPFQSYDAEEFQASLDNVEPTGWTPLGKSIHEAEKDFANFEEARQHLVYIVSDGIETCGEDPVAAAESLNQSDIEAVVNVIGFDVDEEGQQQLLSVADAGGGEFETVDTAEDFERLWERERIRLYNEWSKWTANNYNDVAKEQTNKLNELYKTRTNYMNLTYKERGRMRDAALFLQNEGYIEGTVRGEVFDYIDARHDVLKTLEDEINELVDQTKSEGTEMKEEIQEEGRENKDKYSNS
ncbi:VWA domain-containing protein [Halobacillus fulvus]|nr:VWA domain-containing protein [Halobacillus fulvus]